jgi:hypothetical protein
MSHPCMVKRATAWGRHLVRLDLPPLLPVPTETAMLARSRSQQLQEAVYETGALPFGRFGSPPE